MRPSVQKLYEFRKLMILPNIFLAGPLLGEICPRYVDNDSSIKTYFSFILYSLDNFSTFSTKSKVLFFQPSKNRIASDFFSDLLSEYVVLVILIRYL